jgi:hypothetical protein
MPQNPHYDHVPPEPKIGLPAPRPSCWAAGLNGWQRLSQRPAANVRGPNQGLRA